MKGFMIYETPLWGDEENTVFLQEVKNASYTLKKNGSDDITGYLEGTATKEPLTKAKCSPEDTYDFETGALIALMKKCGVEKVKKAAKETFFDVAENAVNEYEEEIHALKEENKRLTNVSEGFYRFNSRLIDEIGQKNHEIISLKALKLTNESLKKDCVKYTKENEELKRSNESLKKDNESFRKTCEKIKEENERLKNTRDLLISENDKLKLDCEKLQHGYIDTDMIFCRGRQNGKQYTFLVELFKKIDQKKVDTAYKEAYNTKLPVWQKEVLKQMYDIHKESKEKIELPRTLDINGATYRKGVSLKDLSKTFDIESGVMITGWDPEKDFASQMDKILGICKPRTKREEMWENIFELHKESDVIIKVKKEDVNSFLHEIEKRIPEITWMSTVKIFETKYTIGDIYEELKTCDTIYFRLRKINTLSYSSDSHIYPYRDLVQITYLPPMRWDLFKNGRIVVACTEEEVPEFREKVVREFGNIRMEKYSIENLHCNGPIRVYFHYNKDTNWLKPLLVSGIPRVKVNNHKVVYWEDVR